MSPILRNTLRASLALIWALLIVGGMLLLQPQSPAHAALSSPAAQTTPQATPTRSTDPNDFTTQGPFQFSPVTVADFGPVSTNAPIPASLAVSGDWVVYSAQHVVCGHCGYYTDALYANNILTGKVVTIKGSALRVIEYVSGIANVQLHGTTVTWNQPALPSDPRTPTPAPGNFFPGDFNCGLCYYDLLTGKGGEQSGQSFPPVPPSGWNVQIGLSGSPGHPDQQVMTVGQDSTNKVAFTATFKGYWQVGSVAFDETKMVFIQSQSGYGVPQLVRVAWLLPKVPAFTGVWTRADAPVAAGKAARSWLWGPGPIVTRYEQYAQGQEGRRLVQYYDKSRMEINNPSASLDSPGYVTNGLLTVEMISGEIQLGDIERVQASVPCTIPVAGDPRKDNPLTPGYADLLNVATIHGEHQAPQRTGQPVDEAIDAHGAVSKDTAHATLARYAAYASETQHNIPDLFWKYLAGMKATYGFDWTFVLGYPITEAYWTQMRVGGKDMPVMIQAYQRRVLTYVPDFPPTWQVQQGNVGQHYLEWVTRARMHKLPNPDFGTP